MSSCRIFICVIIFMVYFPEVESQDIDKKFSKETIELAATNIIKEVSNDGTRKVIVVNSSGKRDFACYIIQKLDQLKLDYYHLTLEDTIINTSLARNLVANYHDSISYIFLITPDHAGLLFDLVGRPDTGLKLPEENLFCDWLAKTETVIRTYDIDYKENKAFQESLYKKLDHSKRIQVITESGTNITIIPRKWKILHGEIFTAPEEEKSNGSVVIDACIYYAPPATPVKLIIKNGQVINLEELNQNDRQQKLMLKDLNTDKNSKIVAELGIGTNAGAKWNMDLMESEQARGTCHFGFGLNIDFGGQNESGIHVDYVIKNPTIIADGRTICENGIFKPDD